MNADHPDKKAHKEQKGMTAKYVKMDFQERKETREVKATTVKKARRDSKVRMVHRDP